MSVALVLIRSPPRVRLLDFFCLVVLTCGGSPFLVFIFTREWRGERDTRVQRKRGTRRRCCEPKEEPETSTIKGATPPIARVVAKKIKDLCSRPPYRCAVMHQRQVVRVRLFDCLVHGHQHQAQDAPAQHQGVGGEHHPDAAAIRRRHVALPTDEVCWFVEKEAVLQKFGEKSRKSLPKLPFNLSSQRNSQKANGILVHLGTSVVPQNKTWREGDEREVWINEDDDDLDLYLCFDDRRVCARNKRESALFNFLCTLFKTHQKNPSIALCSLV